MTKSKEESHALSVSLHGQQIGVINRLSGDRYFFSFNQNYLEDKQRSTLSLSFKGLSEQPVVSSRLYQLRLPPFFSNLLPEGFLRTYLAEHVGVKPEREFFLLAALGADLPGAVTVSPLEFDEKKPDKSEIIKKSNRNKNLLRFSLAGIQLKFSAVTRGSKGLTIPADGINGSWIVKLPSPRFASVPENEFVMMSLANAAGIDTPAIQLIDMKNIHGLPSDIHPVSGNAFAVQRFDRTANKQRIHMEDFAQVFGLYPEKKYDRRSYANIASVLWAEAGENSTFEFIRRLIFSVMIGNADMHLKNWSLLYPDQQMPQLSPAYDFVATLPYISPDSLALNFGDSRIMSEIHPDQLRRFAETAKLPLSPLTHLVKDTIERTLAAWQILDEKELLPATIRKKIDSHINMVAVNTNKNFK